MSAVDERHRPTTLTMDDARLPPGRGSAHRDPGGTPLTFWYRLPRRTRTPHTALRICAPAVRPQVDRPLIRRTSVLMFPRSHGLAGEETGFVIAVDESARKLTGSEPCTEAAPAATSRRAAASEARTTRSTFSSHHEDTTTDLGPGRFSIRALIDSPAHGCVRTCRRFGSLGSRRRRRLAMDVYAARETSPCSRSGSTTGAARQAGSCSTT